MYRLSLIAHVASAEIDWSAMGHETTQHIIVNHIEIVSLLVLRINSMLTQQYLSALLLICHCCQFRGQRLKPQRRV